MPQSLASCACVYTCQPEAVFSCGPSIVSLGKDSTFSSQFLLTTLLHAIKLFTKSYLIEPYGELDCLLWKDCVHWMAEKVEVLLRLWMVEDVQC